MNVQMEERLSAANTLREQEKFVESIAEYTACLIDLVDTKDWEGLIHCLGGQSLVYKLLKRKNDNPVYSFLMLSYAKEANEIGELHKDILGAKSISTACRVYGEALLETGNTEDSLVYFQRSLAVSEANIAEKGMLKTHIGLIQYKLGDKDSGVSTIKEALGEIRQGEMDTYAVRVWETGALLNLAIIFATEKDYVQSKELATEALEISRTHHLSIREKEALVLVEKLSSGQTDYSI